MRPITIILSLILSLSSCVMRIVDWVYYTRNRTKYENNPFVLSKSEESGKYLAFKVHRCQISQRRQNR